MRYSKANEVATTFVKKNDVFAPCRQYHCWGGLWPGSARALPIFPGTQAQNTAEVFPCRLGNQDSVVVFVLDNYDSFTYNLVQYFGEFGATVEVRRNDRITVAEVEDMQPERIVVSPAPARRKTPASASI